jgi:glycosyltransferase involved in cell wall biosynthesis
MIKFVVCIWNGENYIEKCIESIQSQEDSDFEVFIIDDLSNDRTVDIVKNKIRNDDRFKLIINKEKKFKLKNLDDLISTFDDEDIVIELDGDDYLSNRNVVWDIRSIYKNEKVWLTNGSFIYSNGRYGFSKRGNPNTIRKDDFSFSHLRTWKSFLWKSIPKNYFIDENGEYFKSAADVAYCIAMLELAGDENYRFIKARLIDIYASDVQSFSPFLSESNVKITVELIARVNN